MMKKKVKKIPKYSNGVTAAGNINNPHLDKINTRFGAASPAGVSKDNSVAAGGSGFGGNWGAFGAAATAGGKMLMNAFGVDDNSQSGVTLNSSMQGAEIGGSIVPGWGHLIGGVAGGAIGAFKKGSVDANTGEITYGGIFGRSKDSLMAESDMIKDNIRAIQMTEQMRAKYHMNPNNPNGGSIMAAEGGIMRKPVDALVSKGELVYNPQTKKLSKIPGSNGKPNKKDDVAVTLQEGDMVISNSPTMKMTNGKTPAQNLEGLVDSNKNIKAKEAIIKKVVNWLEANKTKPQEYAMYSDGTKGVKKYGYNKNMSEFAYWDKDKNNYKQEYLDWVNSLTQDDVNDIFSGKYGDMSTYKSVNKTYIPKVEEARRLMTDKKYGDWHKMGESVIKQMYPFPEPEWDFVEPELDVPITKIKVNPRMSAQERKLFEPVLPPVVTPKRNKINDWQNSLYRMAVLSQPLWDRAKAEKVDYTAPVYKYMPTQIDVSSQFRDADQSYALARYNFANLYPNTGVGMAAGLQAASNRAKQYADIRQYQTNAQNELIGKNVGIYNNWSNEHTRILNDVYNKSAQNRAAARNINRQNRAAALNNYGQMIKDDKSYAMDRTKINAIKPLLDFGMENSNQVVNEIRKIIGG